MTIEVFQDIPDPLFSQAEAELTDIDRAGYDDVFFLSKSIGTIIAASYAKKYRIKR